VLQYQISDVVDASKLVTHTTVIGKLIHTSQEDYMKLVKLAYELRRAVL